MGLLLAAILAPGVLLGHLLGFLRVARNLIRVLLGPLQRLGLLVLLLAPLCAPGALIGLLGLLLALIWAPGLLLRHLLHLLGLMGGARCSLNPIILRVS